jgi:hypothetical protein
VKRVEIACRPSAKFREAVEGYRKRDPRVAERFVAEARRTLHTIENFPTIGSRVPGIDDRGVRQMPIHSFP